MTDILRFLLIIILLTVGLTAYFLVVGVLFTGRVEKTQRVIQQMSGRAVGVGLVNLLFFGVIAIVLFSIANTTSGLVSGILIFPALLITAFLAVLLSIGLAGLANIMGEKLFSELSGLRQKIWGSVLLSLACALPFVGWFLLFPYISFVAIGAVILGFFQRDS
jgi:sorbitol-specific phosphotransferase system component IIBC